MTSPRSVSGTGEEARGVRRAGASRKLVHSSEEVTQKVGQYIQEKNFFEAFAALQNALNLNQDEPLLKSLVGLVSVSLKEGQLVVAKNSVLVLEQRRGDLLPKRSQKVKGSLVAALLVKNLYYDILDLDPNHLDALNAVIVEEMRLGKFRSAFERLVRVFTHCPDPNGVLPKFERFGIECCSKKNQEGYEGALLFFEFFSKHRTLSAGGEVHFKAALYALENVARLRELDPEYPPLLLDDGNAHVENGLYEEAFACFKLAWEQEKERGVEAIRSLLEKCIVAQKHMLVLELDIFLAEQEYPRPNADTYLPPAYLARAREYRKEKRFLESLQDLTAMIEMLRFERLPRPERPKGESDNAMLDRIGKYLQQQFAVDREIVKGGIDELISLRKTCLGSNDAETAEQCLQLLMRHKRLVPDEIQDAWMPKPIPEKNRLLEAYLREPPDYQTMYDIYIESHPSHLRRLGAQCLAAKEMELAIRCFQFLHESGESIEDVLEWLAEIVIGRYEQGPRGEEPWSNEVHWSEGVVIDELSIGEKVTCLDFALQVQPKNGHLYRIRGNIFFEGRNTNQALRDYEQAHALGDQDEKLLISIVDLYVETGQERKAILGCLEILEVNEQHFFALNCISKILKKCRSIEAIQEVYGGSIQEVAERNPIYRVLLHLGEDYQTKGKLEFALLYYSFAEEFVPQSLDVIAGKARVFLKKHKFEEVSTMCDQLLTLNEGYAEAYRMRAMVCFARNDPDGAYEDCLGFIRWCFKKSTALEWFVDIVKPSEPEDIQSIVINRLLDEADVLSAVQNLFDCRLNDLNELDKRMESPEKQQMSRLFVALARFYCQSRKLDLMETCVEAALKLDEGNVKLEEMNRAVRVDKKTRRAHPSFAEHSRKYLEQKLLEYIR